MRRVAASNTRVGIAAIHWWAMLVTVDVGNTKTELGLWRGSELVSSGRVATAGARDWAGWLAGQVAAAGGGTVDGIALASVVPTAIARWADVAHAWSVPIRVFDGQNVPGLRVAVREPAGVGPDRVINALGALSLGPAPLVAVDLGTATTFDVVDATGTFLGGAIAPGAMTALDALVAQTARLPPVPLEAPASAIGRDTVSAMQSGAVLGYAALVDGLVGRIAAELGGPVWCVATGGLAARFAPLCARIDRVDPALTMRGLRRAWELSE